jgi:hypothetical protein
MLLLTVGRSAAQEGPVPPQKTQTGERFTVWVRADAQPWRWTIALPVDKVWAVLPDAFKDLGYPGGPRTGGGDLIYLTPPLKVNDRLYQEDANSLYLNCGSTSAGAPVADKYQVVFAILSKVTPRPGGTGGSDVDIVIDGTARDWSGSERSVPVYCTGTGRLETAIFELLEKRLGVRGISRTQ